jgi:ppGpp synthetase/RelA/SpoT-type nucleotidyltranferase
LITSSQTRNKYASVEQYLPFVRDRVRDTLMALCEPNGYALVSRIKTLTSLSEKIESGRFAKWSELDDIIACAVVVPTLTDEPEVIQFLRQAFETVSIKLRNSSRKAPEVFRFDTTRFVGKLRVPGDTSADDLPYQITFEIQVRSAFEHAWSVTTHALTYKGEHVAWNRLRLAAQLKAAVEQLDILVLGFEEASSNIAKSFWPETQAKSDIASFFKGKLSAGALPVELGPQDWTRFSDNVYGMIRSSRGGQRRPPTEIVATVSTTMSDAIGELGRGRIPLSISLIQFVFASLFKARVLSAPLEGYCPVITPEMESLYPELEKFSPRFDFSS